MIESEPSLRDGSGMSTFFAFFEHSRFFTVLLLILVLAAALFVIAVPPHSEELVELPAGETAPYDIQADFEFKTLDRPQSKRLANEKAESEPDYYQIDPDGQQAAMARCKEFFDVLKKRESLEKINEPFKPEPGNLIQAKVARLDKPIRDCLLRIADNPVPKKKFEKLLADALREGIIKEEDRNKMHSDTIIKVIDTRNRRQSVKAEKLVTPKIAGHRIASEILRTYQPDDMQDLIKDFSSCLEEILCRGNLFFDENFTRTRKDQAAESAEKIYKTFHTGERIVKQGETVTDEQEQILKDYGNERKKRVSAWEIGKTVIKNSMLCLVLILIMGLYLFHIRPTFAKSNRILWQMGLTVIAAILLNRLFTELFLLLKLPRQELICFAVPIGFAPLLISIIFGVRAAFFSGLLVTSIVALSMPNQFQMLFGGILITAAGALAVRTVQNYRSFFVRSFLGISLTTALVAIVSLKTVQDVHLLMLMMLAPFAIGLITAMLALLGLFILEMVFDVNTPMSLQSFYDFNHPLLKEMQMKAPGTYHHCLMVSTLAEKAAEEAGLDSIKARVCGMFHDVGKLVQPDYFTENNPGRNPHDSLDPKMSAIIIHSHVTKHGPELARKYKLKRLIYDTITQHHGTSLITGFYKKEQDLHPGEVISETDFRYPPPAARPSDPEITLVMLADCCEAATRSMNKPTPEELDCKVSDIFRKKIRDGQLDESGLTMYQLAVIRKSLFNSLKTMYHNRIAYPKDDKKDEDDLFVASGTDIPAS
ncbi:MAG: HDIG domain-containing protein [Lentisphaeria bacterium]|nr:HDIG domain-containing protein [Lentisphaeria bacterium]